MKTKRIIAVDVLKVLASICIVNSHFGNVWPIGALATGGLIGDCLFFMASGYCLYGIKDRFPRWYLNRIVRIYPAVWISIIVGLIIRQFMIGSIHDVFSVLIYPTPFHFVGSIMVCYIVYYLAVKLHRMMNVSLAWMLLALFIIYLLIYILAYDKTYYHIDVVEENFIRFLYLASMLIGALLKGSIIIVAKVKNIHLLLKIAGVFVFGILYFMTKLLVSHYESIARFQIINQITILLFVCFVFAVVLSGENTIRAFKNSIIRVIPGIAALTLEIYVLHYYFIGLFEKIRFPLNAVLIVVCTLAVSYVVHKVLERLTGYLKLKGL